MSGDEPMRDPGGAIRPEQLFGDAITRRGFLKSGLGGAVVLGMAGLLPAGCGKVPAAPASLRVLSGREYATLNAAALVYTGTDPASEGLDVAAFVDGLLTLQPEWIQKQIKQALGLIEFGPILFAFTLKSFTSLDPAARASYIDGWARSGIAFRRTVHWTFRQLCLSGLYLQSGAWKAIHYDGPWVGRVAMKGSPQRFPMPEGSVKR